MEDLVRRHMASSLMEETHDEFTWSHDDQMSEERRLFVQLAAQRMEHCRRVLMHTERTLAH